MRKCLVLAVSVCAVVCWAGSALAADWSFYGSSRMSTFIDDVSKERTGTNFDDTDLTWGQQGNSRLGARVKAGDVTGRFEYGTGVNLRHLYGAWDFGGGQLLIGHTETPVNIYPANQVWSTDTDMLPFGGIYDGRRPMIQLSYQGLKFALVEPNDKNSPMGVDTDTMMPKIEASYNMNFGPAAFKLMGLYNTFDAVDALDREESVDSYLLGVGFTVAFGAPYIKGDVWFGQNLGNTTMWEEGVADALWTGTEILDTDSMGYLIVAGYKLSDLLTFEAGYGYAQHDRDDFVTEDDVSAYYVNATINLAKGVFIVPEVGFIDYGDTPAGTDGGDNTYYGAKWQINF